MAQFFIDRPIFAWVIALFFLVAGAVAITQLPIAQYPTVAPPQIIVSASYPGASAATMDQAVVSLVEQEMNGSPGLIYVESISQANGTASITMTFEPGTVPDLAQVDVQNRLSRATPRLPQAVIQQGVRVDKARANFLMFVMVYSEGGKLDPIEIGDFASRNILPEIQRIPGVGTAQLFGTERAMRIWLDPAKLIGFGMSAADVNNAIRAQNAQVSAGGIGELPNLREQLISATVVAAGQLTSPQAFGQIVLRANADGSSVRLRDVARVELGGQSYSVFARLNGSNAVGVGIQLSPTGNAMQTAFAVEARMKDLQRYFPPSIKTRVPFDTSKFVKLSIIQVVVTLLEAIALVFVVMYVFLQSFRYTIIPTIVVPVALLGTFGVLLMIGFSINVLTMFAMVLAIGILVDDAIVVVENVERIMAEEGLSPRDATKKAMTQITGAIIGITTVLVSVFVPMAFFGGAVGNIYRQFAVTMAISMLFSAFLALSLTPALCATILKPIAPGHHEKRGLFGWFNRSFKRSTRGTVSLVGWMIKRAWIWLIVYGAIVAACAMLFLKMPASFLPNEDQGNVLTSIQLPPGATANRTLEVVKQVEQFFMKQPEVDSVVGVVGFSFFGVGQNAALAFTSFKPWDERTGPQNSAQAIAARAFGAFMPLRDAFVFPASPPPIPELGRATGFSFRLQDRGSLGIEALLAARNQLLGAASKSKVLAGVRPDGLEDAPQLKIEIDRDKAAALGVSFDAINAALSTALGSSYINDFPNAGRMQRVIVQADADARAQPDDLMELSVPNSLGKSVSFAAFSSTSWIRGAMQSTRYNGYPALRISGDAAPGYSTGDALTEMEKLAEQLPPGIAYEWTGISREEKLSGRQATILLGFSLLAAFLCLAALYESWTIPIAVLLVVPLGILGSIVAATLRGYPNDVYFTVGLVTIIGLSSKNAILIIEFAKHLQEQGKSLREATLEALTLRLRPILMTSLAFILGVMPLYFASGAGSAGQRDIGTGVVGGMISATVLAVLLVPVFFVVVRSLFKGGRSRRRAAATPVSMIIIAVCFATLLLAGCSFTPKHEQPAPPVATQYPNASVAASVNQKPAPQIEWREFFADAKLKRVIELGLVNNRDLRVAVLNIQRAQALYQVQRADQLPTINATASGVSQRSSGALTPTGNGFQLKYVQAAVGFSAYEIDFFGRVRALTDSALAQYLATEEARRASQITLISSIANAYLSVLADDELIAITKDTITSRDQSLRLSQLRFDNGIVSELDVRQAQTLLESARATLVQLNRQRAIDENALVLLVGAPLPPDLPAGRGMNDQAMIADIPAGLPSELLASRPDLRGAEQQLIASNANIGAARAALFPRFALTSSFGSASSNLETFVSAPSRTWSLIPGVSLPIFDAGRNQANVDVALANRDIAVAQYEKTIQSAFREVADALAGRATFDDQLKALRDQQSAEAARLRLTEARYRGGISNQLELLDAQRSLFTVQQTVIQTKLQQLQAQVNLYRALGGGWHRKDDDAKTATSAAATAGVTPGATTVETSGAAAATTSAATTGAVVR